MNSWLDGLAKILIYSGSVLLAAGAVVFVLSKLGFSRLPGDIAFEGKNWKIFIPIGSCIIISIVLTLILWFINCLRK